MLKDVFVQACGRGVFPGVGFMVMGCRCLCRRLVMARGGLAAGAPASTGMSPAADWSDLRKFTTQAGARGSRDL